MSHLSKFLQHQKPDLSKTDLLSWFDNSRIESFLDCNRESWYNHYLGFEAKSPAMAAGSVLHAGLEILHAEKDISKANVALAREYQKLQPILALGANRYSFGSLNEALAKYEMKYKNDKVEYHEQEFRFATWKHGKSDTFPNLHVDCDPGICIYQEEEPETACFWYVGRFDGIVTVNGNLLLLENKTTSQLGPSYLQGLEMSRQARAYVGSIRKILAANGYAGPPLKGVLFNILKLGSTIEFARFTTLVHEGHVREWEEETYDIVSQIRKSWTSDRKPNKNTRSCTRYGVCQFIDLCQAWAGKPKDQKPGVYNNFKVRHWNPLA